MTKKDFLEDPAAKLQFRDVYRVLNFPDAADAVSPEFQDLSAVLDYLYFQATHINVQDARETCLLHYANLVLSLRQLGCVVYLADYPPSTFPFPEHDKKRPRHSVFTC